MNAIRSVPESWIVSFAGEMFENSGPVPSTYRSCTHVPAVIVNTVAVPSKDVRSRAVHIDCQDHQWQLSRSVSA